MLPSCWVHWAEISRTGESEVPFTMTLTPEMLSYAQHPAASHIPRQAMQKGSQWSSWEGSTFDTKAFAVAFSYCFCCCYFILRQGPRYVGLTAWPGTHCPGIPMASVSIFKATFPNLNLFCSQHFLLGSLLIGGSLVQAHRLEVLNIAGSQTFSTPHQWTSYVNFSTWIFCKFKTH